MENLWYAQNKEDILRELSSNEYGLTSKEAKDRLEKYGYNRLPEAKPDFLLIIFLRQFQSPLIYILIVASLIVFILKEYVDAIIIFFTLIFNAIVGTFQEGKAQNTLLALKNFSETNTKAVRDDREIIIPDYEVVPGDVIILEEGDKIPADARIIVSNNLTVDESSLTGESQPIHKVTDAILSPQVPTNEQKNMVFKGTHIVAGDGKAIVVKTGLDTILGKISKEITVIDTEIPLKANIRHLSRLIIIAVAIIVTTLFFLGIILGKPVKEMFAVVVSLSVSIIPEGLPIVMTLVLATGVWRMSKRHALVKKLHAVEALGQASLIAVDKTGTITENQLVLEKIYADSKFFTIAGDGYTPSGEISLNNNKIDPLNHSELLLSGKIAAYCTNNDISFNEESRKWTAMGDPTDSAISAFAQKVGFKKDILDKECPRISEIPFDYKNKYHAVINKVNGQVLMTVIGAPETILNLSNKHWRDGRADHLTKEKRQELEKIMIDMSKDGLRVLAFALKNSTHESINITVNELTFVGFFGLKDALRREVHKAMEKAISAGIQVVMITGDHKATAEAIAKEAGIFHDGDLVLTGEEIDAVSDTELADVVKSKNISVFARVTPEHKLRIIRAYKKNGEVVAMTGDGVNDAPSLVAADLGVSMGKIGTEVAKEASDIVLLDDNFGSIISAVEEGRSIYKTIKKVILYLFSTSFGEVFTISGALLIGLPLPVLAAQIVWLNLVTDSFLDVSLAMEPKEKELLKGNFEHPKKYLIDGAMIKRIFLMAIPMMVGTLYLFSKYYQIDIVKAWTVSLTVLAVFQWFNAWNCRHESKSIFQLNPFSNRYLVAATITVFFIQLFAIYNPFMQKILHTTALSSWEWLMIIAVASSVILVEEVRKFFKRFF